MMPHQPKNVEQQAHESRFNPDSLLAGMQPAFRHLKTGESHLAQLQPGIPAHVYGFAGLPDEWIVERDRKGNAIALHPDVIAGYWRAAKFVALSQLASMPCDD